ncbi:MAG: O-antigen ligase domain-containing protein [Flammeovirgaceae bacterium]|nr:O-antigen ligase domain-containing protein [Flammeovirgaceae bacterium]
MATTGDPTKALYFMIGFLPIYGTYLALAYQQTASIIFINFIKYVKEIMLLVMLIAYFLYKKDIFKHPFRLIFLDKLILIFTLLCIVFTILPIGPIDPFEKMVYLKNILYFPLAYFLGRNSPLIFVQLRPLLYIIVSIGVLASIVAIFESAFDIHLHTLIGYSEYNFEVKNIKPTGNYGLTWTFENGYQEKRFGSFFADPLELAASMLLTFSTALILFLSSKFNNNKTLYFGLALLILLVFFIASSRSAGLALLLMVLFIAVLLRYYRLLILIFTSVSGLLIYIFYFSSPDLQFYLIDTFTFQNSSSVGHLIEWLKAIESIYEYPLGIGLGTSGNLDVVDLANQIGGENQFLIYGVQMGLIALILYLMITLLAITNSFHVYRNAVSTNEKVAPFIVSSVKFGLILPLFTSNAESYLFIFFVTWWLTGYTMQFYGKSRNIVWYEKG